MIAGKRADQAVRELSPDDGLEPIASARASVGEAGQRQAGAVVEEAADGPPVGLRRYGHGPLLIDGADMPCDPWRE